MPVSLYWGNRMKKLYVGNLPYEVRENDLTDLFSPFGNVASARIITDRDTGRSKGFGFVEIDDDQGALDSIAALDGSEVAGRRIRVSEARQDEGRPPRSGGGHGGGGGRGPGGGRHGGGGGGGRGGFGGGRPPRY